MKSFRKIIVLSVIVFGIIWFWLAPNINKAKDIRYTRLYEDTERKPNEYSVRDSSEEKKQKKPITPPKKIYKRESIRANAKLSDIKPYMFSRGMQFTQEAKIVEIDSLNEKTISIDSVAQIQ